ncbi:DUF3054 domain-containing protein [Pseudonocardia pini]|uniref:DUF3054 domain-containing protein n=1 Tax=Pseudonocardia pini TaxID=2758030 RepID=UPI0015EFE8B1|nr:DUF3054 domain-containing protein [Pseudonocardia pini]
MRRPRIATLALAADAVAVLVFAAIGRASHEEAGSVLGLVGTAAPFLVGLVAAWATPWVRAQPSGIKAGAVVVVGTAGLGLLLRAAFTGRLPLSFAIVATVSLAVFLLGWRGVSALTAHLAHRRTSVR